MNIIKATLATSRLIEKTGLPANDPSYGKDHLTEMCEKIIAGEITGEKANRWIGWVQCAICIGGGATLADLKKINKV